MKYSNATVTRLFPHDTVPLTIAKHKNGASYLIHGVEYPVGTVGFAVWQDGESMPTFTTTRPTKRLTKS